MLSEFLQDLEIISEARKGSAEKQPLNVITLFSGLGAPEIALDKLNIPYTVVVASDIDEDAAAVYHQLHGSKLSQGEESFIPNVYDVLSHKDKFKGQDIDLLVAGFSCFTEGTLIMTDHGMIPIEEIKLGDLVLTHKGRFRKVLNLMQRTVNKIKKIKGAGVLEIESSLEHPYYIFDKKVNNIDWKNAEDIIKGDYFGTPLIKENLKISDIDLSDYSDFVKQKINNPSFWYFIGRFVGDGFAQISPRKERSENSLNYRTHIACALEEKQEVIDLLEAAGLNYTILPGRQVFDFQIYNKDLTLFLRECGHGAANKHIHPLLWKVDNTCKQSFLDGYLSADGSKYKTKYDIIKKRASTISKTLLYELKMLIAQLYKMPSCLVKTHNAGKCIIEDRLCNKHKAYGLTFSTNAKKRQYFVEDDIVWSKIKKTEILDKECIVYNIEVEEDNSYTANGIIVHNCQAFSTSGKGYGINSRKVIPLNKKSDSFVVNQKYHLTDFDGDYAVTVDNNKNDPLPSTLPPGTKVYISPDSDGKLAFETLKIANNFKPKVIVLENVSSFALAPIDNETADDFVTEDLNVQDSRRGASGLARLAAPKDKPEQGGYLRKLSNIFTKMGYQFFPLYLDPTSYADEATIRRPRIYIIGIRNDIAIGVAPNKMEKFEDSVNRNFNISTKRGEAEQERLMEKTLNYIMQSKYSEGFMTSKPRDFVRDMIRRFGMATFAKATDYIFDSLVENGSINLNSLKNKQVRINEQAIDKFIAEDPKVKDFIEKRFNQFIPRFIDLSGKDDTVNILADYINKGLVHYFDYDPKNKDASRDKSVGINRSNILPPNPLGQNDSEPNEQDISVESPINQLHEEMSYIVSNIILKEENKRELEVNPKAVEQYKLTINKKLLITYLFSFYNKYNVSFIPTILKANTKGNEQYFILRNKEGKMAWGTIHPAIYMKLMGMYTKEAGGDDDVYQAIMATTLKNGKNANLNTVINRVGNSMSVDVLEKLFKSLISMKAM